MRQSLLYSIHFQSPCCVVWIAWCPRWLMMIFLSTAAREVLRCELLNISSSRLPFGESSEKRPRPEGPLSRPCKPGNSFKVSNDGPCILVTSFPGFRASEARIRAAKMIAVQHFDSKATQEVLQRPKKIKYPC